MDRASEEPAFISFFSTILLRLPVSSHPWLLGKRVDLVKPYPQVYSLIGLENQSPNLSLHCHFLLQSTRGWLTFTVAWTMCRASLPMVTHQRLATGSWYSHMYVLSSSRLWTAMCKVLPTGQERLVTVLYSPDEIRVLSLVVRFVWTHGKENTSV